MTKPKYMFVISSLNAGGAERSLIELLPRLMDGGAEPVLVTLQRGGRFEKEARAAGYGIVHVTARGWIRRILDLRRLIRSEKPSLLYTSLFDADQIGRVAAIGTGVPVISNLANTSYESARLQDPNVRRWRLRIVWAVDKFTSRRLTDHFHAVSETVKDSAVEQLGVDPNRVTVVRRGREKSRIGQMSSERRRRVRESLGIDEGAEVVMTAGRQEFQKGHTFLLEAFAGVAAARPQAVLVISGREGHASATLNHLVESLGLFRRVFLLGHREDVTDIMAAADVFTFPSLYEGLGGAVIEAMGLGLPIVASDLPSLREVVHERENATLVPPGDATALEAAVLALLNDQRRREAYGKRSREIYENEFRGEVAAVRMQAMLNRVASGNTNAPLLDDKALDDLIADIDLPIPPDQPGASWSVTESWKSFKADFLRLTGGPGSPDIAVKIGHGWSADDARYVATEVHRVGALLRSLPGGEVVMPETHGWSEKPPAVALRFVTGDNLLRLLGDPVGGMSAMGKEKLDELVTQCGQAMGAYHSAEPADRSDRRSTEAALDDLMTAARRAGVSRRRILAIEPHLLRARGYRFSGNDVTVDSSGRLVLHDPPHVRKFDYVHRDVSGFTFDLHRSLFGNSPHDASHPNAGLAAGWRRAFLDGYEATGPTPLDTAVDEWAIRLYEISRITGRAYGALRRRRLTGVPTLLRWAAQARRQLGPPPL